MLHVDAYQQMAADAAAYLAERGLAPVDVVVQCGSGLSAIAKQLLPEGKRVNLADIPHLPSTAVSGHGKEAVHGRVGDINLMILTGRIHVYEGHSPALAGLPAAIAAACGARLLIVTNAAGALNTALRRDSFVIHKSYINFQGDNPLACLDANGSANRFVDPEPPYDPLVANRLDQSLQAAGAITHHGTYLAVRGPIFETKAELQMMRGWGADVVGMSTVPEVIISHLCRLPVAGVSLITNECFTTGGTIHSAVLGTSRRMAPVLANGIHGLLESGVC